jgi:ABC-2 type transport system permease protein
VASLIRLHFRKTLTDRSNYFWLLGMPMMFSVLMGFMFGSIGGGTAAVPVVTVFDASRSPASAELVAALGGRAAYAVAVADSAGSLELALGLVRDGRRTAVLYIPADFATRLGGPEPPTLHFCFDSDRASAQTARTALEEELHRRDALLAGRRAAGAGPFDVAAFDSLWAAPRVVLDAQRLGRLAPDDEDDLPLTSGFQHTGPSYTLMFVMMFMLMSVRDVVAERHLGTLRRLRLGASGSGALAVGLLMGPVILGLCQMAVLLGLNALLFGIDYGDSPATLILLAVLFTTLVSALSLFIATYCRTAGQADGLGMTFSMLMAALGGLWWPLEIVPPFMQRIGLLLPTGRAITVFHNLIGRGWGLQENAGHLLWLGATLALLLFASMRRFRRLID